jgi:hypothetical protein
MQKTTIDATIALIEIADTIRATIELSGLSNVTQMRSLVVFIGFGFSDSSKSKPSMSRKSLIDE